MVDPPRSSGESVVERVGTRYDDYGIPHYDMRRCAEPPVVDQPRCV